MWTILLNFLFLSTFIGQNAVEGNDFCVWCDKAMAQSFMNCVSDRLMNNPRFSSIPRGNINDMKKSMLAASNAITMSSPESVMMMLNGAMAGEIVGVVKSQRTITGQNVHDITAEIMDMIANCYISVTGQPHARFKQVLGKTVDFMFMEDQPDDYDNGPTAVATSSAQSGGNTAPENSILNQNSSPILFNSPNFVNKPPLLSNQPFAQNNQLSPTINQPSQTTNQFSPVVNQPLSPFNQPLLESNSPLPVNSQSPTNLNQSPILFNVQPTQANQQPSSFNKPLLPLNTYSNIQSPPGFNIPSAVNQPLQGLNKPATFSQPFLNLNKPSQGFNQQLPTLNQKPPVLNQPSLGLRPSPPILNEPSILNQPPSQLNQAPPMIQQPIPPFNRPPLAANLLFPELNQPYQSFSQKPPATASASNLNQPSSVINQPRPETVELFPGINQGDPAINQPPTLINQEPTVKNQPPPVINQRTPMINQGPSVINKPLPGINQGPPVINQGPPVINQGPPVINQPPPVINQPPPVINLPPPVINQPPSAIKQPPPTINQQSPTYNQPPTEFKQLPQAMIQPTPTLNLPPNDFNQSPAASQLPQTTNQLFPGVNRSPPLINSPFSTSNLQSPLFSEQFPVFNRLIPPLNKNLQGFNESPPASNQLPQASNSFPPASNISPPALNLLLQASNQLPKASNLPSQASNQSPLMTNQPIQNQPLPTLQQPSQNLNQFPSPYNSFIPTLNQPSQDPIQPQPVSSQSIPSSNTALKQSPSEFNQPPKIFNQPSSNINELPTETNNPSSIGNQPPIEDPIPSTADPIPSTADSQSPALKNLASFFSDFFNRGSSKQPDQTPSPNQSVQPISTSNKSDTDTNLNHPVTSEPQINDSQTQTQANPSSNNVQPNKQSSPFSFGKFFWSPADTVSKSETKQNLAQPESDPVDKGLGTSNNPFQNAPPYEEPINSQVEANPKQDIPAKPDTSENPFSSFQPNNGASFAWPWKLGNFFGSKNANTNGSEDLPLSNDDDTSNIQSTSVNAPSGNEKPALTNSNTASNDKVPPENLKKNDINSDKACAMRFSETLYVQLYNSSVFPQVLGTNTPKNFANTIIPDITNRSVRDSGYDDVSPEASTLSKSYITALPENSKSQSYAEKISKSIMVPMFKMGKLNNNCEEIAKSIAKNFVKYLTKALPHIKYRNTASQTVISTTESPQITTQATISQNQLPDQVPSQAQIQPPNQGPNQKPFMKPNKLFNLFSQWPGFNQAPDEVPQQGSGQPSNQEYGQSPDLGPFSNQKQDQTLPIESSQSVLIPKETANQAPLVNQESLTASNQNPSQSDYNQPIPNYDEASVPSQNQDSGSKQIPRKNNMSSSKTSSAVAPVPNYPDSQINSGAYPIANSNDYYQQYPQDYYDDDRNTDYYDIESTNNDLYYPSNYETTGQRVQSPVYPSMITPSDSGSYQQSTSPTPENEECSEGDSDVEFNPTPEPGQVRNKDSSQTPDYGSSQMPYQGNPFFGGLFTNLLPHKDVNQAPYQDQGQTPGNELKVPTNQGPENVPNQSSDQPLQQNPGQSPNEGEVRPFDQKQSQSYDQGSDKLPNQQLYQGPVQYPNQKPSQQSSDQPLQQNTGQSPNEGEVGPFDQKPSQPYDQGSDELPNQQLYQDPVQYPNQKPSQIPSQNPSTNQINKTGPESSKIDQEPNSITTRKPQSSNQISPTLGNGIKKSFIDNPDAQTKLQINKLMTSCLKSITKDGYNYNNLTSTMAEISKDLKKIHSDWSGEKVLTVTYLETIVACTQVLQKVSTSKKSSVVVSPENSTDRASSLNSGSTIAPNNFVPVNNNYDRTSVINNPALPLGNNQYPSNNVQSSAAPSNPVVNGFNAGRIPSKNNQNVINSQLPGSSSGSAIDSAQGFNTPFQPGINSGGFQRNNYGAYNPVVTNTESRNMGQNVGFQNSFGTNQGQALAFGSPLVSSNGNNNQF